MNSIILIIDDEPDIVKVLSFWLEANGYEVIFAHLGKEGIDLAVEKKPLIILLDYILPDMSGAEVLDQLKSDSNIANIPVILMSASNEGLQNEKVKALAVETFLKPIDHKVLLEKIKKYTPSA